MHITSKKQATIHLKNLLGAAKTILKAQELNIQKIKEVKELEKDAFIGLELEPEQKLTLANKNSYAMISTFLEKLSHDYKLNTFQNLGSDADEDRFIKECVESIFLEKKEKDVIDEKRIEMSDERDKINRERQNREGEQKNKEKMDKEIHEKEIREANEIREREMRDRKPKEPAVLPPRLHDETLELEISDSINVYPKARIPYAWKSGQVYEGGKRERKRETERKNIAPAKEYRGWNETKESNGNEDAKGWGSEKTNKGWDL